MKTSFSLFVRAMMLAVLPVVLFFGNVQNSKAQSPCAGVAPTNVSWGPLICEDRVMTMPNSAVCTVYVCYYERTVSGVKQYCIAGASSPSNCYDLSNLTNFDAFFTAVGIGLSQKYTPSPCPGCPEVITTAVEVFNAGCHKLNNEGMVVSCTESFYCKRTYSVCCDWIGNKIYTLVSTAQIGTVVDCPTVGGPGCYGACDPY